MNRLLLGLVLLLITLIAASRAVVRRSSRLPAATNHASGPRPGRPPVPPSIVQVPLQAVLLTRPGLEVDRTPVISRMARNEARRRLAWAGPAVYLDSMFVSADSMVRRWNDRPAIRVAIVGSAKAVGLIEAVRAAIGTWRDLRFGVELEETADSAEADIIVGWVDRFEAGLAEVGGPPSEKTGLTEVQSSYGEIQHAAVWLALADPKGHRLTRLEMQGIATHELGHALGLPHSARQGDIMYPTVGGTRPSDRDRSSIILLYSLPSGPLREPSTP